MFKEEYQKLFELIEKSEKDPQNFSLEEVLTEAAVFFEELRKTYPIASMEERQVMLEMMQTLHKKLQLVSKKLSESTGMTEEEFRVYSENPSNFPPEQWHLIQETRKTLFDSARKLSQALEQEQQSSPDVQAPRSKPIRNPTKRAKRKDWKKS